MSQAARKEKAAKAPPVKLKPLHLIGLILLLLVSIAFMAFGAVMMTVLMDSENEYELSKTQLAQQYKWLIQQNPFFSAFFTNGGLIGTIWCLTRFYTHHQAVKAERVQAGKKKKQ